MRITSFIACTFVAYLGMASLVEAQSGTEIVIPAGAFVKDYGGKVEESGGQAGMDMQHGAYRFPEDKGSALVGITTLLPADWVGEDIDVYFGGSCGGLCYEQFRIIGELEATGINTTTYLTSKTVEALRCKSSTTTRFCSVGSESPLGEIRIIPMTQPLSR